MATSTSISVLCLLLALSLACLAIAARSPHHDLDVSSLGEPQLLSLFDSWNAKHGKHYEPHQKEEKHRRFHIFRENLLRVESHNKKTGHGGFKLGLNKFADLTNEEFRESRRFGLKVNKPKLGSLRRSQPQVPVSTTPKEDLPESLDWRSLGAVTSVKDQGMCGSCWAFSATGAIEGANAIATGNLVSVSEQELVSCDLGGQSAGCNGGLMDDAFEWVIDNGGIATEEEYLYASYWGDSGECDTKLQGEQKTITIDGLADVFPYSEEALLEAISKQPVSVAIEASAWDFQLYVEGVYNGTCSSDPYDINHGVLLVGYGTENGVDYWLVKNSWGDTWGDQGYIKMIRNGSPFGICAIHSMSSYPIKNSDSSLVQDS